MNVFDAWIHTHLGHFGWTFEAIMRVILAALAGGVVGAEREIRGREAGFRTHILVCMASALVMVVSIQMTKTDWQAEAGAGVHVSVDLIRIGYAVMTGIGFLGAGTILQHQGSVRGLTTAAAMWSVAAIGLAAGFGMYVLTLASAGLVVLALWLFDYVGDALPRRRYRNVVVRRQWHSGCMSETIDLFKSFDLQVVDAGFERTPDLKCADITLRIAFTNTAQYYTFEKQIASDDGWQLLATRAL